VPFPWADWGRHCCLLHSSHAKHHKRRLLIHLATASKHPMQNRPVSTSIGLAVRQRSTTPSAPPWLQGQWKSKARAEVSWRASEGIFLNFMKKLKGSPKHPHGLYKGF